MPHGPRREEKRSQSVSGVRTEHYRQDSVSVTQGAAMFNPVFTDLTQLGKITAELANCQFIGKFGHVKRIWVNESDNQTCE